MTVIILFIILGVAIYIIDFYCKGRKRLSEYLRSTWGKQMVREYTYSDFENIRTYWELKHKVSKNEPCKAYIDELTWSDLDMEEVFAKINNTQSIIGESYLYDRLHCVHLKEETLRQFENLLKCMDEKEETRLSIQLILNKLGKHQWNRIPKYLFEIDEKKSYYKSIYNILGSLPLVCLPSLFVNIELGTVLVCGMMAVNAYIHYKSATKVAYEMGALNNIYLMVKTAKKLSNFDDDELKPICEALNKSCSKLKDILSLEGKFFLSTNTDLGIIQEYLGIITLSSLRIHHKFLALIKRENKALHCIYEKIGELEASIAVASYRRSLDEWCTPEYVSQPVMEVEDLYHPLIDNAVTNTVKLDKNTIITGSNASGKSTFIKALAINGILSQSIHTVLATKFRVPLSYYMTSMAISDNIITSESYYIAEIRSLKRIIDSIEKYPFCICFIDEILKGTNTIERIAASSAILKYLNNLNCLCFIASHDIEITQMLGENYENYHFREKIEDSKISFDYQIYQGPSTTRNAIKLLEVMAYDADIVNNANRLATHFSNQHVWLKL